MTQNLHLDPIEIPHQRQPPKRFSGGASPHRAKSPEEHFRAEYFKVLDTLDSQSKGRFNQPDLQKLKQVENALTGQVDDGIGKYPEIDTGSLMVQWAMFHSKHPFKSAGEAKSEPSLMRWKNRLGCCWSFLWHQQRRNEALVH